MKFIQKVHNVIANLEGKNIATKHSPERVDELVNHYIVEVYNIYLDNYVKTGKIDDYMLPFKRSETLTVTAGIAGLPEDYGHFRVLATAGGLEIPVLADKFWYNRKNSKKTPPSTTSPIARIENSEGDPGLEVYPHVGTVTLEYFKYPTPAKYGYTVSGSRYVYDDATSVDIEFPLGLYPDIVKRVLGGLGIVLREGQITQITEHLKTQDQLK